MKKILLILLVFLMTGCYDYNELNDLDIISSIIVDYEDDEYVVNLEVLNTQESAEKGSHYVHGSGKTIEEAMNDIYFDSNYIPFYGHLSVFVVSDVVAEKGLESFYDYFLRDTDFRKDFYLFVSKNLESILEFEPTKDESFGEKAKMLVSTMVEQNGKYRTSNFREIVFHYLRNLPYIMGGIYVEDENITLSKDYVFNDNKVDFEVEEEVALFLNILSKENESFQMRDNNTYMIHEYELGTDFKKDKIILELKGGIRLLNISGSDSLSQDEMKELEKDFNAYMEKLFKDLIDYSRKSGTDIFNFNYLYYLHFPKLVKDDTWETVEFEIKSDLRIQEKGMLLEGIEGGKNG